MKKFISLVLALVLCFSISVPAFAAESVEPVDPWADVEIGDGEVVVYKDDDIMITTGGSADESAISPRWLAYGSDWTTGGSGSFIVECQNKGRVNMTLRLEGDMVMTTLSIRTPTGQNVPDYSLTLDASHSEELCYVYCNKTGTYTVSYFAVPTSGERIMCWLYG